MGSGILSESTSVGDEPGNDGVPDYLADAGQRLEWANGDGQTFQRVSEWLIKTGAYAIWVEFKGDRWQATFRRIVEPSVERQKLSELSLALGSFLEHSRAALNYAAYQLALLAIREDPSLNSPERPRKDRLLPEKVEYPIVRNPGQFRDHNGIRNLPDEYRAIIESKQPYDGRHNGLWMLQELAREYRHRVVHAAAITPVEDMHHVFADDRLVPASGMEVVPHERIKDGDVLLRFTIPDTHTYTNVAPKLVLTIGIDHRLTRGLGGMSVLNEIGADVMAVLDEIEAEHFPLAA